MYIYIASNYKLAFGSRVCFVCLSPLSMRFRPIWAPKVYRLIDAALIGNFFSDPFLS